MRALLFATATMARFVRRRSPSSFTHWLNRSVFPAAVLTTARTVDQKGSQVLVASLTDPHEYCSIPAGMLARDQTQTSGHVAPVVEVVPIPHCGDDGGRRLEADASDPTDALAGLIRAEDLVDTTVERLHPLADLCHQLKKG